MHDIVTARRSFCAAIAAVLAGCAGTTTQQRSAAIAELGATGKLRAAINFGNPILASRDASGAARGVSVDLAREAARRGFIEEMKASGFVADALQRHGIQGAAVAPRAGG